MTARAFKTVRELAGNFLRASAQFRPLLPSYRLDSQIDVEDTMNYITVVRGKLKTADLAEAQSVHDGIVARLSEMTRPLGAIGHQPHLNPQSPGEFLAIDTWSNLAGLQQFMSDPAVAAELGAMFASPPDVSVWAEAGWAAFRE
jgi:hypothetical protein